MQHFTASEQHESTDQLAQVGCSTRLHACAARPSLPDAPIQLLEVGVTGLTAVSIHYALWRIYKANVTSFSARRHSSHGAIFLIIVAVLSSDCLSVTTALC